VADGSRADAAFDRAVAAYREGSYDTARQWVLEALAQDSSHARARELLARLDAARRPTRPFPTPPTTRPSSAAGGGGPETVSIDPTVLINQASRAPITERIDPTILIRRDDGARKRAADDPFATPAPRASAVSEPTIIADRSQLRPPARTAEPAPRPSPAGVPARSWRERWFGGALVKRPGSGAIAGVGVVLGAVVVAALLLFAGIAAFHWLTPSGERLTLTPPTGGTLLGPGLKCGTRGTDCSTTLAKGEAVELTPQPDDQYVLSRFTVVCASGGRTTMTAARTCGAVFNKVAPIATAVTFPLTIIKPDGGSIVGAGGILCGSTGNACSANIPSGEKVELRPAADNGYMFVTFTGDCAQGDTTMTAPRVCGATFTKDTTSAVNIDSHDRAPVVRPPRPTGPPAGPKPSEGSPAAAPPVAAPPPTVATPPAPGPPAQAPPPTVSGPVAAPMSAEDHAKNEIQKLVNDYCKALDTRDPKVVRTLFPLAPMADLHAQFDQYKSLRCTLTSPPAYDRLDASASGGAQLKFGMKQQLQSRSGGAPQVLELIITMVASRKDFNSPWLIDRIQAESKPKN
jgi:hypothetical protein